MSKNQVPSRKKINPKTVKETASIEGPHSLLHSIDEEKKPLDKSMSLVKKSKPPVSNKNNPGIVVVAALVIVGAGTLTGFGLSKAVSSNVDSGGQKEVTGIEAGTGKISDGSVSKGDVFGDASKEGDEAEGVLEKGGINGEGSHRLLRPGGVGRTVYLTSSVVDLDQLVGHKVKVWGDTFAAQSAGWLMDVVTVEVVELNAEKPFEEE